MVGFRIGCLMTAAIKSKPEFYAEVFLIDINRPRPTEEVDPNLVEALVASIKATGLWSHPILIDENSGAIMDGHHRFAAAKRLGLAVVPAVLTSYDNPHIHLESWRQGLHFSAQDVLERARSGHLLPQKSTRHITDFIVPQVRVPVSKLRLGLDRQHVPKATQHPTRSMMLVPAYSKFCAGLFIKPNAAANIEIESPETQVPHAQLRRMLQSDPAMCALLAATPGRIVLGYGEDSPFFLMRSGHLRLSPSLLNDASALAIAARWGIEASHLQTGGLLTPAMARGILLHGRSLLKEASTASRDLLLSGLPAPLAEELQSDLSNPSAALLTWQWSRIEGLSRAESSPASEIFVPTELWNCVETLLVSGGDTRLAVDRKTGFNKYGTVPRPRPEAVHFSSSTASSISDYGFMYCDMLRRDMLTTILREKRATGATPNLYARAVDATAGSLLELLGLDAREAGAALAASGTDTETLAVTISLTQGKPLTNILIAPEETGRGVRIAGAGQYYDSLAACGDAVVKGQPIWPSADIQVVEITIRDDFGVPRTESAMADEINRAVDVALSNGRHVLLHALASSKTGLAAPSDTSMDAIVSRAPQAIDVVVDACQMRTPFRKIGDWVRNGWMVQVSGSKFLTGPAFSGALIVPRTFHHRAATVGAWLAQAPAICCRDDWTSHWRNQFPGRNQFPDAENQKTSFGMIFRWLPALLEANLFNAIPEAVRQASFKRFRDALNRRLDTSEWLIRAQDTGQAAISAPHNLAAHSILCFSVSVLSENGTKSTLNEDDCRRIFTLLNRDLSGALGSLSPSEAASARLQAHIGQPVSLKSSDGTEYAAVLRMVLGARFFSMVAHAGPDSAEAALESEIADAVRALEKLELLSKLWDKARHIPL
eukprot:gene7665-7726_t